LEQHVMQVFSESQIQQQLRAKRWKIATTFVLGLVLGGAVSIWAPNLRALDAAFATELPASTSAACFGDTPARATLRLDCSLRTATAAQPHP
jgi:hypothetical protein